MKRLGISFFYDNDGILDDYMIVMLKAFRPFIDRIVFVVNGKLTAESEAKVAPHVDEIVRRDNTGFDVWAYKAGLEHVGYDKLGDYDEVLLFNHTFFAPIYPFSEMFGTMDKRACDFWGITAHRAAPATDIDPAVPYHLNSHFFAVRKSMAASQDFADYWRNMVPIRSYEESILLHELKFTNHFKALGYKDDVYMDPGEFGTDYGAFFSIDDMVLARSPILKRRPFFHDPMFLEEQAIDLARAVRLVEKHSDYDMSLVWQNIYRTTQLRIASTNASLLKILPDQRIKSARAAKNYGRVAVCVHAYYDDLIEEILDYTAAFPVEYDFIVTTDTEEKKKKIEAAAKKRKGIGKVIVRVPEQWRGRDMGALLVCCYDLFAEDNYDIVCRLHTKKSPQVKSTQGNLFKRHMLENTVNSAGFITNILDMFADNPKLGLVMPPVIHISYPTLGHAWFVNKERTQAAAKVCNIDVPFDGMPPVATYGGMFWFRPKAIRKLFAGWKYEDFEGEPHPTDGGLAHALERLVAYAAQDSGYLVLQVLSPDQASLNYTMLEYKMHALCGHLPTGDFRPQNKLLAAWRHAHELRRLGHDDVSNRVMMRAAVEAQAPMSVKQALRNLEYALKCSIAARSPRTRRMLAPLYRKARGAFVAAPPRKPDM